MVARTPWLDRKFQTGLPLSALPTLLERLRGTPCRVEERLRGLPSAALTVRHGDSWSIKENVGHLVMVEDLWAGRLDDFEARRPELRAARFESWRVGEASFNEMPVSEICARFRRARRRLVERLEHIEGDVLEVVARHPRLDKPMRVVDLMLFAAEHDDHHLARLTELARGAEPSAPVPARGRYHHLGLLTSVAQPGETYLERYGFFCTDEERNPFGIQWMRYEPDCPLPDLVKTLPHVAFEVDDLASALEGHQVLIEPNSPSKGVLVAFIVCDGAPVELIQFTSD